MAKTGMIQRLRQAGNRFILRTLPPCKEIVQIVSASLDRPLTFRERAVMKLHLVACRPCLRYMEQSYFLSDAASRLDDRLKDELFTGRLSNDARERIKNALKSSAGLFAMLLAAI